LMPASPEWIVGSESRAKFNDLRANSLIIAVLRFDRGDWDLHSD
jgi:hypothetical protein